MTRDEFKNGLTDFVDSLIDTDRELTDEDEGRLIDNFSDVANDILENEGVEAEEAGPDDETK
jgi:hypothetical protein